MRLIDAEHLINKAEQEKKDGLLDDDELETIYYELGDEPTVDAVPVRHGKWIGKNIGDEHYNYCSECRYIEWNAPNNYCPNCGAKMDDRKEE